MVYARVVFQRWVGDYAMQVGEEEFDCQKALDNYFLDDLPEKDDDWQFDGDLSYGDDVFRTAVQLKLVKDWHGPFELYVNPDDYTEYLSVRKRTEQPTA